MTLVPALLLLLLQVLFAGSFAFLREQPVPVPGDHASPALLAGAARDVHDAGAVVAVEERRFVGILYAGIIFFTAADLRRAATPITGEHVVVVDLGRRRISTQVVDVIFRLDAALRDAVAGVAARRHRA